MRLRREMISPKEEDAAFIDAIVQRDKKQFEVLYKKYYQQLFAVAYRYVKQQQIAEEIVHDVFIKIWNKADELNIQYSMKSYLFKAMVNSSLNYIKKEKMDTEKKMVYLSAHGEFFDEGERESEEALLAGLEAALELLPAKCREVMYLSRFGKLKQNEIASQLGISVKTVKNHLTYGFQKLRDHLNQHKQVIISPITVSAFSALSTLSMLLKF
ncbi:RNA polymerase sigma-70 factor [Pedobacter frigoris]|uniref:RNA polymerase sigma factor n=1 Tax=Pedobacter frigoris TaxID=2571272 RepID=UPI00292E6FDB|nr:RNA polymerase sigma-70 factor [Pedobacter frigoris]